MIAYEIQPTPVEPAQAVASLRASRTGVVIVARNGKIVAADSTASRILDDIGPRNGDELPDLLALPVRRWLSGELPRELVLTDVHGYLIRAMEMQGLDSPVAVLIEPISTRENLQSASRRFGLSPRELDVVRLLLEGESACEIAQQLRIAEYTVGDYLKRIFTKTRVRNRSEMLAKVLGWRPNAPESA